MTQGKLGNTGECSIGKEDRQVRVVGEEEFAAEAEEFLSVAC